MDYYDVGDTVTLIANFTVRDEDDNDVPTDPASVTGRVRPPSGVIFDITPLSDEVGEWKWDQVGDAAGDWRWEIVGDGNADGVQAGAFRVRLSALDQRNANTFVTPDDIETALRRTMSLDEYDAADQLVNQLVAVLELRLNRDLVSRTYIGERHTIKAYGEPLLWHGPLGEITGISTGGASVSFDAESPWWGFYPQSVVYVDYTTNADHPQLDAARAVVINAVVRTLLQGPKVASGAIKSYSVEGTSITYGDNTAGGQGGRITVGDLTDIMRLKRRVIVWAHNDPIFPLPEPDFLWVHDLTIHQQGAASVVTDDDGNWEYAPQASVGFVGYATAPNPREVERAATRGVLIDCVVLAPNGVAVDEDDDVTVPAGLLGFGGTSIPATVLQGRYSVIGIRPNPSHTRVLLTRIKGEDPRHAGT